MKRIGEGRGCVRPLMSRVSTAAAATQPANGLKAPLSGICRNLTQLYLAMPLPLSMSDRAWNRYRGRVGGLPLGRGEKNGRSSTGTTEVASSSTSAGGYILPPLLTSQERHRPPRLEVAPRRAFAHDRRLGERASRQLKVPMRDGCHTRDWIERAPWPGAVPEAGVEPPMSGPTLVEAQAPVGRRLGHQFALPRPGTHPQRYVTHPSRAQGRDTTLQCTIVRQIQICVRGHQRTSGTGGHGDRLARPLDAEIVSCRTASNTPAMGCRTLSARGNTASWIVRKQGPVLPLCRRAWLWSYSLEAEGRPRAEKGRPPTPTSALLPTLYGRSNPPELTLPQIRDTPNRDALDHRRGSYRGFLWTLRAPLAGCRVEGQFPGRNCVTKVRVLCHRQLPTYSSRPCA